MNMRITSTVLTLGAILACAPAGAQQEASATAEPRIALWTASFGDTTKLTLNVSTIVSVSMHPYMLNGQIPITEVTVDTLGNNTLRFYYIHEETRPPLAESAVKSAYAVQEELTRQKGTASLPSVKFPEGAYAHSVEYKMNSLDDLTKLYKSLVSVWERSGKKLTTFKTESK